MPPDHPDGPCHVHDCHHPKHHPSVPRDQPAPANDVRCEIR